MHKHTHPPHLPLAGLSMPILWPPCPFAPPLDVPCERTSSHPASPLAPAQRNREIPLADTNGRVDLAFKHHSDGEGSPYAQHIAVSCVCMIFVYHKDHVSMEINTFPAEELMHYIQLCVPHACTYVCTS